LPIASQYNDLSKCRSLAVLGGTFDPVHMGHMMMAETVLTHFSPQRVLFMTNYVSPHKTDAKVSNSEHRYQMLLAATCDHPAFDVSRLEIDCPGSSYTIDTIRRLKKICQPGVDLYFVIGADAMLDLHLWKDAAELLRLVQFIVIPRTGIDMTHLIARVNQLQKQYNARLHLLCVSEFPISSTDIRQRFARGDAVRGLLPRAAEDYARRHNLYAAPMYDFEMVKTMLRKRLSHDRFMHTLGVVETVELLAYAYGENAEKARWAALLHDCAKEYSADKMRALCHTWDIPLDEIMQEQIDLTHALLSAESARRDFYVNDASILQAIRYHATGHAGMTMLDKIVMLADYIEPNRYDYGPLVQMRALAYSQIDRALVLGLAYTLTINVAAGRKFHPLGHAAMQALKENIHGK